MKEFKISAQESGQKCIKYCEKLLPNAGTGFLYKMLRKKNITLNGKKADGTERLSDGDILRFFFSDETFLNFSGKNEKQMAPAPQSVKMLEKARIIYEDENVLLYNKPSGLLSQKATVSDVSLNEMLLSYLAFDEKSPVPETGQDSVISRPSVCNRLDRNTSGIVICGKTYQGLRAMNELLADRNLKKYYHCLVVGEISGRILLKGYLLKNEKKNTVEIFQKEVEGASYIETEIVPLAAGKKVTLLEVHLITGKTHQIRSHLAFLGHPILGDYKYGERKINDFYRQRYGLRSQLLHAYRIEFPQMSHLKELSGRRFTAEKPELFKRIEKEEIRGNVEF